MFFHHLDNGDVTYVLGGHVWDVQFTMSRVYLVGEVFGIIFGVRGFGCFPWWNAGFGGVLAS